MVNITPITRPLSLGDSVALHLREYFSAHQGRLPPAGVYDRIIMEVERPLIQQCLDACYGNQIKAAELLGINRNTLRKKIRVLGITVSRGNTLARQERQAA
jgi:two-component system nitrogen regulation response regulator GlnG